MDTSFIGAIWYFAGNFAILNFAPCNGQLIPIGENTTLYSLLGTTYGGDGVNSFGLPDLRGRVPIGQGRSTTGTTYVLGQIAGNDSVSVLTSNMPAHTHLVNASSKAATTPTPSNTMYLSQALKGGAAESFYNSSQPANAQLVGNTIGISGGSIPIEIVQPVLAATYMIALYGVFPSQ